MTLKLTGYKQVFLLAIFLIATVLASGYANAALGTAARVAGAAVEDHSMTIVIRPAVNLEAPADAATSHDLTLAEIVDPATIPSDAREAVMRHLRAIALTDRPNLGEERTFTQEGLEAIVGEASRRLEAAGYTIEWKIPRRSSVSRRNSFSKDAALKLLREEFVTRCGGCDVQFKRVDWPATEALKISSWSFAFRGDRPRGSFSVPLELELASGKNETTKKTLMVSGQVEFFSEVPVATRAMNAGEIGVVDRLRDVETDDFCANGRVERTDFEVLGWDACVLWGKNNRHEICS